MRRQGYQRGFSAHFIAPCWSFNQPVQGAPGSIALPSEELRAWLAWELCLPGGVLAITSLVDCGVSCQVKGRGSQPMRWSISSLLSLFSESCHLILQLGQHPWFDLPWGSARPGHFPISSSPLPTAGGALEHVCPSVHLHTCHVPGMWLRVLCFFRHCWFSSSHQV